MKTFSPLLGFNDNVKYRGRLFHVQTEDSGVQHPHIITHLFADGGRILKTLKTSYSEQVGRDDLPETVRSMMKAQHRKMFAALRDGEFDVILAEGDRRSLAPRPLQPSEPGGARSVPPGRASEGAQEPTDASRRLTTAPGLAAGSTAPREKPPSGRFAVSRPVAAVASLMPESRGSLFGDDAIREKSLDEVILSYLSEECETKHSRK